MTTLQEALNQLYPTPQSKEQVKEIIIGSYTIPYEQSQLFEGNQLNLAEYPNLERIRIWGHYLKSKLTELNLSGCSKLVELDCSYNQLTNLNSLNSLNSKRLTILNISYNNITSDLNPLRKLVNLTELYSYNNPLYGSLEPLKGMVKLKGLYIDDTNLDSGLEYLSESVKKFYCSADKRKGAKVKAIYNLFANDQGKVETEHSDGSGGIKNFPQKLQEYKQKLKKDQKKKILLDYIEELEVIDNQVDNLLDCCVWYQNWFDTHKDSLDEVKKLISYCKYVKLIARSGTLTGASLAFYQQYPIYGISFVLGGTVIEYASDFFENKFSRWEKRLEKLETDEGLKQIKIVINGEMKKIKDEQKRIIDTRTKEVEDKYQKDLAEIKNKHQEDLSEFRQDVSACIAECFRTLEPSVQQNTQELCSIKKIVQEQISLTKENLSRIDKKEEQQSAILPPRQEAKIQESVKPYIVK